MQIAATVYHVYLVEESMEDLHVMQNNSMLDICLASMIFADKTHAELVTYSQL